MAKKSRRKNKTPAQQKAKANRTAVKTGKSSRAEERVRQARMKQIRYGGLAVILIAAFVGLAVWRNVGAVPAAELAAVVSPNLLGSEQAPVKVVEYGDLACSACRQWHNLGIWEQLTDQYGDQISFEFRHYPVITANSPKGAEAGQCAAEQESFWEFHDYIYENLGTYPNFTSDLVKEVAAEVNLDQDAFATCVDSGKYRLFVNDAIRRAQGDGARGTPTFFVNGRQVSPTLQSLSAAIAEELN